MLFYIMVCRNLVMFFGLKKCTSMHVRTSPFSKFSDPPSRFYVPVSIADLTINFVGGGGVYRNQAQSDRGDDRIQNFTWRFENLDLIFNIHMSYFIFK